MYNKNNNSQNKNSFDDLTRYQSKNDMNKNQSSNKNSKSNKKRQ